jgi:hypothetical protein
MWHRVPYLHQDIDAECLDGERGSHASIGLSGRSGRRLRIHSIALSTPRSPASAREQAREAFVARAGSRRPPADAADVLPLPSWHRCDRGCATRMPAVLAARVAMLALVGVLGLVVATPSHPRPSEFTPTAAAKRHQLREARCAPSSSTRWRRRPTAASPPRSRSPRCSRSPPPFQARPCASLTRPSVASSEKRLQMSEIWPQMSASSQKAQ